MDNCEKWFIYFLSKSDKWYFTFLLKSDKSFFAKMVSLIKVKLRKKTQIFAEKRENWYFVDKCLKRLFLFRPLVLTTASQTTEESTQITTTQNTEPITTSGPTNTVLIFYPGPEAYAIDDQVWIKWFLGSYFEDQPTVTALIFLKLSSAYLSNAFIICTYSL